MRYKTKFAVCVIIFAAIVVMCAIVFSQQPRHTGIDEEILSTSDAMLVKYYRTTMGAVVGGRYEELVLSTTGNAEQLRLDYSEGDRDSVSVRMTFIVPAEAAQLCYRSIENAGMRKWNEMNKSIALCGVGISCSFRDGNEYVSASTNAMPEDGEKKLGQIERILRSYMTEEYEVTE